MNKTDKIKQILTENKEDLKGKFKVKEIGIFGSYIRKEEKKSSDIDILVEFEEAPGLFEFLELKEHLSELLGKTVDLVMKKSLKPNLGKHILEEVVMI